MSTTVIFLLIVGAAVILALGAYAGKLLARVSIQRAKLTQQMEQQQRAIKQHNEKLVESITLIAKAICEQQCELSEGAIRICRLLEKIYLEQDANYPETYPALHQLDSFLADYPTHAGYKALKRQDRMRFDVKRAQQEQQLKQAIEAECSVLTTFSCSG